MMALVLGSISAVAFTHAGKDRLMAAASLVGLASGVGGAFISGSRGAVVALPIMVLCFAPLLRRLSSRSIFALAAFMVAFVSLLLAANVGNVTTRLAVAYDDLSSMASGHEFGHVEGDAAGEAASRSDSERVKLLALAWRLFHEHPLFGAGAGGWDMAVEQLTTAPDPSSSGGAFNQHITTRRRSRERRLVGLFMGLAYSSSHLPCSLRLRPFSEVSASHLALAGCRLAELHCLSLTECCCCSACPASSTRC